MVTQLGCGMEQAHLEGNSLTRRAPQGAVGRWALRTRGHLSIPPRRGRQSGQDLSVHTRLPEPGMGTYEGARLQRVPRIALGAEEPCPGLKACPMGQLAVGKVRGRGCTAEQGEGGRIPSQGWGLQGESLPHEGQRRGNHKGLSIQKPSREEDWP